MRSRNTLLFLLVPFFLLLIISPKSLSAQIRKGVNPKHRSFYFSAGYNKPKYFNSTINIDQPKLGNSYSLVKVKADNLTNVKALFPWQLNYRLGYYFNYDQTCGFEINYDPVNYHITDGESVQLKGTYNNVPNVNKTIPFLAKNGYYYGIDGANLILLNFVRRFTIYRPNSNRVGIDAIAKAGAGPLMPHFLSSLPVSAMPLSTFDDPQFQMKGWNAAGEAALRVTVYRYGYVEIAAKYDYAMYNNLKVYEGTAKQNLATTEIIGSIGFTFPSNRFNPLFHHEKKIITILPFFQNKITQDSIDKHEAAQKRIDGSDGEQIEEVPEFKDIVDKKTRRENRRIADSTYKQMVADSIANQIISDSLANIRMKDSIANQAVMDSVANQRMMDSLAEKAKADSILATMPLDSVMTKPVVDSADHKESKKERKARLKKEQEEKDRLEKEKAEKDAAEKKESTETSGGGEQDKKEQEQKDKEQKEQEQKDKEKKEQEQKEQEQKDKEKKEQEQKEQEQKDKEKREADKQAEKDKKAAEKQAKKDQKEAEKKAREEAKEKERAEKEALKEKERKDKEEQAEKDRKEKEEKDKAKEEGK